MRSIFEITEKGVFQQIAFTTCRPLCTPETETGRIFYSPPRPDQKKLLTAPTRPELNLSFAPRPASPRSEFHLCSPAPPRPDLSFTFAPRPAPIRKELLPAPPRLQKIHLFFENIIYLIIQYKGSVNKIGTHAEKCVQ